MLNSVGKLSTRAWRNEEYDKARICSSLEKVRSLSAKMYCLIIYDLFSVLNQYSFSFVQNSAERVVDFQEELRCIEEWQGLILATILSQQFYYGKSYFDTKIENCSFSRFGFSRHHQHGRWQARIGRVAGNKDLYLGTFSEYILPLPCSLILLFLIITDNC